MFLHKKAARVAFERLKTAVKLDFGASSADLVRSCNVEKVGNRLFSRFKRRELFLFSPAWQAVLCNDEAGTVCILTDEGVYSLQKGCLDWVVEQTVPSVSACVYRGVTVVSSKEMGTYYILDQKGYKVYDEGFSSMAVCADRVFGLQGNVVRYTKAGERDGWANGEMITLPTACEAIVAVEDKIYALGNTCYTISPKGDDVEFKFAVFAHNLGATSPRSVASYNGRAVFATDSGMYQISLGKISPIFTELNDELDFSSSAGTFFEGKFYLSCRSKNSSETASDVTLALDLDREEIAGVLDIGYDSFCALKDELYCVREGHFYWYGAPASEGRFVKSKINFGTGKKKFLDRLTVKTINDLDVTIRSETETRLYKIKGKKIAQKINLRGMGWEFSIELSSVDGLDVENLMLEAHASKEV